MSWRTTVISALWEAEAGTLAVQGWAGQFSNLVRFCLKIKRAMDAAQGEGHQLSPQYHTHNIHEVESVGVAGMLVSIGKK